MPEINKAGYTAATLAITSNQAAPDCEVRGAWLNPHAFRDNTARLTTMQKVKAANINTLFVLAPPIGNSRGWSTASSFSLLLQDALAADISVHLWVANRLRAFRGRRLLNNPC